MAMDLSGSMYNNDNDDNDDNDESDKEGYEFKNYYVDSYSTYLDNEDYKTKVLYEGTSSYIILLHNLIIYIENANNECETKYKKIYYKIKNNTSNKITLEDAFNQLDEQSKEQLIYKLISMLKKNPRSSSRKK
jgi:hypothetical protein